MKSSFLDMGNDSGHIVRLMHLPFWYCGYPQALCYQEQNQLFLWSADYFWHDLSVAGGLADYISEFLVQFYYVTFWCCHSGFSLRGFPVAYLSGNQELYSQAVEVVWDAHSSSSFYPVAGSDGRYRSAPVFPDSSDLSPAVNMAHESCYPEMGSKDCVGRCASDTHSVLADWRRCNLALCLPPSGFFLMQVKKGKLPSVAIAYPLSILYLWAIQLLCYSTLLVQYPLMSVMAGINYYRVPMRYPGQKWGYDKDLYALVKLNEQVRNGKWEDIIHDAQENQVQVFYTSNCVNLALAQTRQLADRMFSFYQSGENALLAPVPVITCRCILRWKPFGVWVS